MVSAESFHAAGELVEGVAAASFDLATLASLDVGEYDRRRSMLSGTDK